jgi:hypothetical protein
MRTKHIAASIAAVVIGLSFTSVQSAAGAGARFAPDRMEWKLTIKPEPLDRYLDFPGSEVGSINRIAVYFQPTSGTGSKPVLYKNYYYKAGKPIGSKQVHPITLTPDSRGPIILKMAETKPDPDRDAKPSADVMVRLFLDLYTSHNFPQFIVVDDAMFKQVVEAVKQEGFNSFTLPLSRDIRPKPKAIMVLKSERSDQFQYMMYQ